MLEMKKLKRDLLMEIIVVFIFKEEKITLLFCYLYKIGILKVSQKMLGT